MNRWHSFWQYVGECLRLLYWAFFKPFTFNHWLQQEVHPELNFNRNPFGYRQEFANNLPLKRYADQFLWLNLVMPWLLTLLVAMPYILLVNGEGFLWSKSTLVLCGWDLGVLLIAVGREKIQSWLLYKPKFHVFVVSGLIGIVGNYLWAMGATSICTLFLGIGMLFSIFNRIAGIAASMTASMAASIAVGILGGMAGIVALGMTVGMVFGGVFGGVFGINSSIMSVKEEDWIIGMETDISYQLEELKRLTLEIRSSLVIVGILLGVVLGLLVYCTLLVDIALVGSTLIVVVDFTSMANLTSGGATTLGIAFGVAFGVSYLLGLFRLHFWIFELVWMLVLRLRYTLVQADQALRWLPPRFDEVIYLPLPFITELITEAYLSNSFAAQQTLNYLLNFTNQHAVVRGVILNRFLGLLQICKTEYDVAYLVDDQPNWIIPEIVGGNLLPQCLDISRNVHSAFNATSAYKHKELLAKPIKELTQLRQQLAFEKNPLIRTSLGQITQSWLAILETAQNVLLEQIKQSGELPAGAYVAGNALDPELADANFRGRVVIFAEIENLMLATQPPILLLYGGRRTGKTSALKQLPKRMGTDFVPLLVDMQGVAEASTLLGVAEGIAKQMQESARSSRNMILPSYDIQALQRDPFPALRDWFKAIEKKFPNKRFLLCMDEFERLEEVVTATQSRAPLNFLRSTYQHHNRWLILFSGSHHPDELADYWSDYLINTRTLSVSYLQEDEARDLIEHPNNDFPAQVYDSLAIEEIIRQTHCQPYLVQLLCQNVIELINQDKRRQVVKDDVIAAMPRAIERGQQYFAELWNETLKDPSDRSIIKKLLSGEVLSEEEKQRVPYLLDKNIIEASGSTYRFQVPIVDAFLRGKVQAAQDHLT